MQALIIEDNDMLRELYKVYLEQLGFEVTTAAEGGEAFALLKEHEYNLIMTDMHMPGVNGKDFYQIACDLRPGVRERIIFATGDCFDEALKRFLHKTGCPVLIKPFSFADLRHAMQTVMVKSFIKSETVHALPLMQ